VIAVTTFYLAYIVSIYTWQKYGVDTYGVAAQGLPVTTESWFMDARAICLAILSQGEASGYEIRKAVEEGPFAVFSDAGFGSIYPALKRMSEEGLIQGRTEQQDGRPAKIVYSITQKGKLALLDVLGEAPEAERFRSDHLFRLFFAHLMPVRAVEGLIDERLTFYRDKIAHLESKACHTGERPGPDFVRGFGLALYVAAARYLEEHGHELLAAIAIEGEMPRGAVAEPAAAPQQAAE
jgi:DNA-binding PadR family transcriptional regulator